MKIRLNTLVFAVVFSLAASANAGNEFKSVYHANSSFQTNSVAGKRMAFAYVADKVRSTDGKSTGYDLGVLRTMAVSLGMVSDYDEACGACIKSPFEGARFVGVVSLAQSPTMSGKDRARALELLAPAIRGEVRLDSAHRLEVEKTLAGLMAVRLDDVDGAVSLLDSAIKRVGGNMGDSIQLRLKKLDIFVSLKRDGEIERTAREILALEGCPGTGLTAATTALVGLCRRRKDAKTAGELLVGLIARTGRNVPEGIASRLFEADVDDECLVSAVDALRRSLAKMPLGDVEAFQEAVVRIQPEVVRILNRLGRSDEALAECRAFVFCAPAKSYQKAVTTLAYTLKKIDGNLGRATAFMEFQRRGVVPTARNVMMCAPKISDGVRAEALRALPTASSTAWKDSLGTSVRLLWLDEPVTAVREAMYAFSIAPFDAAALQQCANAATRPVLLVTRNPKSAGGIVDYLTYGANGRDGVPGTKDDLASPLAEVEPLLAVGRKE